jgi:branched-chain amino acid aminotransferase
MAPVSKYIWMDGELVPYEKATLHFMTPALHYGMGVFEGIRCYATSQGPAVFRGRDHLQRLLDSVKIFGFLDFGYSLDDLHQAMNQTILANEFSSCYIRPLVYSGNGSFDLNLDNTQPSIGIAVWEWGAYLGEEALEAGVRMMVSSFARLHPNVSMTKAKISGNYVNSVLAKTMAERAGFEEAIMLDPEGLVSECTGENLFLVRKGVIYTTPRATILEGITRDSIITIARDLGYTVHEEPISRDQLYIADEVFVSGTAAECTAVSEVDYRPVGTGRMGPVTRQIQTAFFETVRGEGPRSAEWLDYVPLEARIPDMSRTESA